MNVHFVQVAAPGEVTIRTWERGSGVTGACGSGACAVCVAGVLTGRSGQALLAHLPGGELQVTWDRGRGHVLMTGPAVEVFSGDWYEQPTPVRCGDVQIK
jgi:diaminopimelate epimerase